MGAVSARSRRAVLEGFADLDSSENPGSRRFVEIVSESVRKPIEYQGDRIDEQSAIDLKCDRLCFGFPSDDLEARLFGQLFQDRELERAVASHRHAPIGVFDMGLAGCRKWAIECGFRFGQGCC